MFNSLPLKLFLILFILSYISISTISTIVRLPEISFQSHVVGSAQRSMQSMTVHKKLLFHKVDIIYSIYCLFVAKNSSELLGGLSTYFWILLRIFSMLEFS